MVAFVVHFYKFYDPEGWNRGEAQKYVTEAKP